MSDVPRPEYPRPQFVRKEWLNLNGPWQFEFDFGRSGEEQGWATGKEFSHEIIVPFAPESELSGIGRKDFMDCVWYRRTVEIPESWSGQRILLHFGAVDYETTVWVNGRQVAWHCGGYTPFSADITEALRAGGNEIVVRVFDDVRSGLQARGKQSDRFESYGCLYTRTTGIWQTVWMEPVPRASIRALQVIPDLDNAQFLFRVETEGADHGMQIEVEVKADGAAVGKAVTPASWRNAFLSVSLDEVRAWSPADPFCYDVSVRLKSGETVVDEVQSYAGLRKVHIEGNRFLLNNRVIFQRLVLDQGFYPDGIYTAASDEVLKRDIELSMAMGFDGARLHQKVFEPRFLYWADRLGYIVWGEYPNWGADLSNAEACERITTEWLETVRRDFNHPSIIGWCPFNETNPSQRSTAIALVYNMTRAVDPTRPVLDTSGYVHVVTDVYDCHDYDQNTETFAERHNAIAEGKEPFHNFPDHDVPYSGQPYFVSEYGGIWWNPGQQDQKSWGYGDRPRSEQEFLERYRKLTESLLNNPAMCGFCYTQLYDVEQEVNGLYTYDRKAKFDPKLIYSINKQKAACEP